MAVILWVLSRNRRTILNPGDPILNKYTGQPILDDTGNPKMSPHRTDSIAPEVVYAAGVPFGRTQSRAIKGGWSLCQLRVDDPAHVQPIKDHPDVFAFFENDEEVVWDERWQGASLVSPNSRGWNPGKFNRAMNFLETTLGVDTTGLTRDSTIAEILQRVAIHIEPEVEI